jgi:2-polyprenyl-3-methyl-5-hydroxy-6-metoxy-1,4-benzoquinol methylase
MNRSDWLKVKRFAIEERYDRLWAPIYDDNWGATIDPLHQRLLTQIVNTLPIHATILDAACGTGKYWPILLDSGRDFIGIDQSNKMLERAYTKFPQVPARKVGLQELRYHSAFDLVICMDAMEMVFPEDWPVVLHNFSQALKPSAPLYFTVEVADLTVIDQDYHIAQDKGLPVVRGESIAFSGPGDSEGGYHYYPSMDQVRQWLNTAGFVIKEEAEADDYHHFWVRKI